MNKSSTFPEFQDELCRLLEFTADVAEAIRMNSAYAGRTVKTASWDVRWLSDALHNFNRIAKAIRGKNLPATAAYAEDLIDSYRFYKHIDEDSACPANSFARHERYFKLDEAIEVFEEIKAKAVLHITDTSAKDGRKE